MEFTVYIYIYKYPNRLINSDFVNKVVRSVVSVRGLAAFVPSGRLGLMSLISMT